MAFNNPSVEDFKARFFRDFPYGTDVETSVLDEDIAQAFIGANGINPDLYGDQGSYTAGYLLLAAHHLVLNIRASSQGLSGGAFSFAEQSKAVGSVSQSFAVPQEILNNPIWAVYASTRYGMQWLASILPLLSGQMFTVCGSTRP